MSGAAAFEPTVTMLGSAGLAPGSRVIIEKPFGTDLASARALNNIVNAIFGESQAFRIDHFLGKESVDNILASRSPTACSGRSGTPAHRIREIDVPEMYAIAPTSTTTPAPTGT